MKKRFTQKRAAIWWLAVVGAAILLGCGGKDDSAPADPGEDPKDEDAETVNPGPDDPDDY